ncbi:hypothetical protein B484DRAFT_423413, partial [Ochromonadaceae sp. CCMP2298]
MGRGSILLALGLWLAGIDGKLLKLTPIKCQGSFVFPSGTRVPAAFLSKEKLEILQDEGAITLCDVVPILIPDDPMRVTASLARPVPLDKLAMLTMRDNGVYDNLPYAWGTAYTKKGLYTFLNEARNKAVTLEQHFSLFQAGMADQLDLVLTGLLVEVEDSFADGVSLGGAMVLARPAFASQYTLSANPTLPSQAAEAAAQACVVNCRLDELVGFALSSGLPVHMSSSLYDRVAVDASLVNNKDQNTIIHPPLTQLRPRRSAPKPPQEKEEKKEKEEKEEKEVFPAWEIFDPRQFFQLSAAEKREILRASGVRKLPRPRQGALLDDLLLDLMDDAVRGEVMRLQYVAAREREAQGQGQGQG